MAQRIGLYPWPTSPFYRSEEYTPPPPVIYYVDKDHPNASDSNDGLSEANPFASISKLTETIQAGATGLIKEAATPYFEDYRLSGQSWGGPTFSNSGTAEAAIVVEAYPGHSPVIDQQLASSTDGGSPLVGFVLPSGVSHVRVSGIEITQCSSSGIMCSPSSTSEAEDNNYIVFSNLHVHHCYGGDNVGGIRLDWAKFSLVKNCEIHDIYDTRGSSNPYTPEPYALHSGIHGFRPGDCIIENNDFYHLEKAVHAKTPYPTDRSQTYKSHTVRYNTFEKCSSCFTLALAGGGQPPVLDASFYGNAIVNCGTIINANLVGASAQSTGLLIYNNTANSCTSFFNIRELNGVEYFNNIATNFTSRVIETKASGTYFTGISYCDHNDYHLNSNIALLNNDGTPEVTETTLAGWQTVWTDHAVPTISFNPDGSGRDLDPQYVDDSTPLGLINQNTTLNMGGRGGAYSDGLGAFTLGVPIGRQ